MTDDAYDGEAQFESSTTDAVDFRGGATYEETSQAPAPALEFHFVDNLDGSVELAGIGVNDSAARVRVGYTEPDVVWGRDPATGQVMILGFSSWSPDPDPDPVDIYPPGGYVEGRDVCAGLKELNHLIRQAEALERSGFPAAAGLDPACDHSETVRQIQLTNLRGALERADSAAVGLLGALAGTTLTCFTGNAPGAIVAGLGLLKALADLHAAGTGLDAAMASYGVAALAAVNDCCPHMEPSANDLECGRTSYSCGGREWDLALAQKGTLCPPLTYCSETTWTCVDVADSYDDPDHGYDGGSPLEGCGLWEGRECRRGHTCNGTLSSDGWGGCNCECTDVVVVEEDAYRTRAEAGLQFWIPDDADDAAAWSGEDYEAYQAYERSLNEHPVPPFEPGVMEKLPIRPSDDELAKLLDSRRDAVIACVPTTESLAAPSPEVTATLTFNSVGVVTSVTTNAPAHAAACVHSALRDVAVSPFLVVSHTVEHVYR